jgi:hypothetical protein
VAEEGVVLVAGELFCREFPVAVDEPFLYAPDNFGAAFAAIEHPVQIPFHIAKVFQQRGGRCIPVGENQPLITLNAGHFVQAPVGFTQPLRVGARLQRHINQFAVDTVRPSVIWAGKRFGVAAIGVTYAHCAVAALVQKCFDAAILLTNDNHRIFAHVGVKKVACFGDLALVRQKQPAATENTLKLQLINIRVGIDKRGHATVMGVDQ